MEKLNNEDYKNILRLLSRVDLKGNEAITLVVIQQKLSSLVTEEPKEISEFKPKSNK